MKKYQFLLAILEFVIFMVFDGWVYMCVYDLGFAPFISNFNISLPIISYKYFIVFAGAIHVLGNTHADESKQYSFNDMVGWSKVVSVFITKLFWVFCLWLVNIILL